MDIPTMRTIDQASTYIRQIDPNTAITKTALRRLVVSGKIPSRRVGQKYLVSIEAVSEFLNCAPTSKECPQAGKIRPVSIQSNDSLPSP